MTDQLLDLEMAPEAFLEAAFEQNYQNLRLEVGRALAPNIKEAARRQVRLYWEKLGSLANSVTDTEVRLSLPNQTSTQGRRYTIEGVVDIVREAGYCVMYDIKSMTADSVRANRAWFEQQLNVYAHIWQHLRGENLQQTAIIATACPERVEEAWESGDEGFLAYVLAQWNPIVEMTFDAERVDETVAAFGEIVDAIEERRFAPPTAEDLNRRQGQTGRPFATDVCNECDARFSCRSYRRWAATHGRRATRGVVRDYFSDDADWEEANLAATPEADDLQQDYVAR